jgi:hypothetical protein
MRGEIDRFLLIPAALALCSACHEGGPDVPDPVADASLAADAAQLPPDAEAAPRCLRGQTRSCACQGAGNGTQTCADGEFGACLRCSGPVEATRCVAGYYEGVASGSYRSSSVGVPGVITPFDVPNSARWTFVLERDAIGEFYTVGNGCVHVIEADTGVDDGSSRFMLTGQVDCATGVLEGQMRGFYSAVGLDGTSVKYYYRGRLRGTFDLNTKSFVDTAYAIREPMVLIGDQPGGAGTWTVTLREDSAPATSSAADAQSCLGNFPADSEFPDVTL